MSSHAREKVVFVFFGGRGVIIPGSLTPARHNPQMDVLLYVCV